MSKLQKYLAKEQEATQSFKEVTVDGEQWTVRKLNLQELRKCVEIARKDGKFDAYKYNDAQIVLATEHDFPWSDEGLLKKYKAGTKYEVPAKMFNDMPDEYAKLLEAVELANKNVSEAKTVNELKN